MMNRKPRPWWVPGFPSCKVKWIEKILRSMHCFFFKKYYGAVLPGIIFNTYKSKPTYIWNASSLLTADDIVSSQPMAVKHKIEEIIYKDGID